MACRGGPARLFAPDFGFNVKPNRVVLGVGSVLETPLKLVFTEPEISSNDPLLRFDTTAANPGKTGNAGVINCPVIICGIWSYLLTRIK